MEETGLKTRPGCIPDKWHEHFRLLIRPLMLAPSHSISRTLSGVAEFAVTLSQFLHHGVSIALRVGMRREKVRHERALEHDHV